MNEKIDTTIATLGERTIHSPLPMNTNSGDAIGNFVPDTTRIRYNAEVDGDSQEPDLLFEKAGPREKIFFDPAKSRAAIVTCGGLCPGLNNVIRSAYRELCNYGVPEVWGIRYGYEGLNPAVGLPPVRLTPEMVEDIHYDGGTILGSSRGNQPVPGAVDFLQQRGINILLTIGGDGTQRGAHDITVEARRRGFPLAVAGIPKTVDNDIMYVTRTFGFSSAVDMARTVLACAHMEARSYRNGIGLVRLMGRDSGFIAAVATLASQEVNFVLIPEVPFKLDGESGFLNTLKRRLARKGHALIVVAEGAGQDLLVGGPEQRDSSGNVLHKDIGLYLRDRIMAHFKEQKFPVTMKYIDPSYIIRSVPANAEDCWLCDQYARNAVHAAMAGKTDLLVGKWNGFIHVPLPLATVTRQKVIPGGPLWNSVLSATGQPAQII
jgi:6-phosphofructokinase 1